MHKLLPVVAALTLLAATAASAHVERPSYWPDPKPDTTVTPAAGGEVPTARPLITADSSWDDPATTSRVVCQPDSLERARASYADAIDNGYVLRPSQPRVHRPAHELADELSRNEFLFGHCRYHSIQAAIDDSGNNDRVLIMPGVYTEPEARAVPTPDPACAKYKNDVTAGGAVSYRYHFYCPHDANLIAVNGRALGPQSDSLGPGATPPTTDDRHGIPNAGPCIRCNLQIEGTGAKPDDVVIEAGDVDAGDGGPSAAGHAKDVGIKVDRADGIVIRNLKVRHAREHDIYVMETDGYLLEDFKAYYAGEYGVLTFGVDHGVMRDCDSVGNGDAALYPGGAPDTGAQRDTSWYPTWRFNQTLTRCDMHHNNLGYSGTMGNATHVIDNDIYDNATGITTDSYYAGGHPGYPQDSASFEGNRIYSNNFNDYLPSSDVKVATEVPVGVGILIAGGNDDEIKSNFFYDNWRRAVMLFSVPTELACPAEEDGGGCTPKPAATNQISNSFDNRVYGNHLGVSPGGAAKPNGLDFWWDAFPTTTGNCFYANGSYTSDPSPSPVAGQSVPGFLPEDCKTSLGTGDADKDAELLACAGVTEFPACTWAETPPKPGTTAAKRFRARSARLALAAAARHSLRFQAACVPDGVVRSGLSELGCRAARAAGALATTDPTAPQPAMQAVTCTDWKAAGGSQRAAMIASLTAAATVPDPENPGVTLSPGQATDVFDRGCSRPKAANYTLYVIYNRAAAFHR
jgi:hypothetical protein